MQCPAAARIRDPGSDLKNNNNVGNMPDEPISVDILLTCLWHQFLLNLTVKAPNQKGVHKPSYCILTAEQCLSITEATYQNMTLSDYFLDCQWKITSDKEWTMVFDRFFPLDRKNTRKQNFKQMDIFLCGNIFSANSMKLISSQFAIL
ncbi:hypothetical protein CPB84DRAFT_1882868 [Gymnopilus junonius]|uniref:Uncharacterized protein n=1 Tax=Gymnopilus junonius TaxID=109634 RepID=A0A9P5NCY5_GYMJU|nr:hypothetical protein CPB84DRAFT_1882868 [Gymnopilus junonius]